MEAPRPKWLWATSYLKVALNPIGAASALALITVWLMEFNWPSAHAWFGRYPVTIGLITGLLNLVFTLSLVNRIIERRDELRWRDIRNTTLKGLNDEVRATRDILWIALWGHPPFGPGQHTEAACKVAKDSGAKWPKAPARTETADARAQIQAMECDADRTQAAAKILRLATERIREGLVRWAPMMTLAHGDYQALVPVTTLADVLEVMEFPFAEKRIAKAGGHVEEIFHEALRDLWLHAITTCVYAEENIVRALYPRREYPERSDKPWTSEEPRTLMLTPAQLAELELWLRHPLTFRLGHARRFRADTRNRSYAVTSNVEWPW
ncbi:MAG: hypothetical protein ACRDOU_02975 [Streptosporangiaceae bacterium]